MPRATLTVTVPESVWIGTISRDFPDARMNVLSAIPGETTGVGLVELTSSALPAIVEAFASAEDVTDLDILKQHEETALLQFETADPMLLFPIMSSGIPLEMPFELVNGEAVWEVTASQDRLSELGDQLDAFGIRYAVEEMRHRLEPDELLTDRQRRLVDRAIELGYYETPRTCTLTELAEDVGVAKSTCSETLHRAEGTIVRTFHSNEFE